MEDLAPLDRLAARLAAGESPARVRGAQGPLAALVLAGLVEARGGPLMVVCADEARSIQLGEELAVLRRPARPPSLDPLTPPELMIVPEVDVSPYSDLVPDRRTIFSRQAALFRLLQGLGAPVVICSLPSLQRRVLPPSVYDSLCDLVGKGQQVDRDGLAEALMDAGYQRLPLVEDPGTFTLRGNVVDFYPPVYRDPVRLEFDGDDIKSVRLYDPVSQRTLRELDEAYLHPVRETMVTAGAEPRERLLELAEAAEYPSSRVRFMLGQIDAGADFFGAESLVSIFHRELVPLWEYFRPGALWVLEDPAALQGQAETLFARHREAQAERLANRQLAVSPADIFVTPDELQEKLGEQRRVSLEQLVEDAPSATPDVGPVELRGEGHTTLVHAVRQLQAERGQEILGPLAEALEACGEAGQQRILVSPDLRTAEQLAALLGQHGVTARIDDGQQGYALPQWAPEETAPVEIRVGYLSRGVTLPVPGPALFAEEELFGPKVHRAGAAERRRVGIGDLSELTENDYVVHEVHGVGRYEGLRSESVGRIRGDFMLISYRDEARLFLPVHRFKEVHRYVGAGGRPPRRDRLGGTTWEKRRRKVAANVRELAEKLLQLYAQRAVLPGEAVPPPDELFRAFEATFPFTETPDQQQAIEAVLEDLASPKPMDRLVCGDVGYGKTEVALRAAVLAVMGGRQVAVLGPTTVLVEQHLATFTERLRNFPVNVAGLSRFRARGAQNRILKEVAAGRVDIVIGTHRLLSKDVRFERLGLIIVDEEQRFGVSHKERLKQLRTQVDVLTLTATPIPRTLHMALLGIRDLSIITTPPTDRQAVRTYVTATSPTVIRDAVRRELARGGQIFFVTPYIMGKAGRSGDKEKQPKRAKQPGDRGSLRWWAEEIRRLVPEAKVAEAHGQLDDRQLERVMAEFVAGHHDVLVCTSLVESGLDIPRANTMFIQEADRFGLAQLYQLRGRIGRGRHRAYCMLMVDSLSAVTPEARRRLEALQRFSDLGAGFHLATADLEIRGTGDLLGAKQSGAIGHVGFEEYSRIMEEAVAELKGEPLVREQDPDLVSDLPSFIPDDYVWEPGHRLHFYRRLADVTGADDAAEILEELRDRFGPPPDEVCTLADLMVLKALARGLGARAVELSGRNLTLVLDENTKLSPDSIRDLVVAPGSTFRFTPDHKLLRRLGEGGDAERLEEAKKILHELMASGT